MKYCNKCIIPVSRPNIIFDAQGICSACNTHVLKAQIDWAQRERAFREVVARVKARSHSYDCLIPVSGGKDSTWQVLKCLEYGLHPLAVTWRSPARTELGQKNLDNLVNLGVDHIDYRINPDVEKKFMYKALVRCGSPAIPMHMALFSIPWKIAVKFGIPLIVWGENAAAEYSGDFDEKKGWHLDGSWMRKYGVTNGTTAQDWVSENMTREELTAYFGPTEEEVEEVGMSAVFLGYYFLWDPATTLAIAQRHGFSVRREGPKTGFYNYADIDDDFISIHHWLKWYKFGFTRTFDNLSIEIRNARITRAEAIEILAERGDETPHEDIEKFCRFLDITLEHFFEVVEKFRNPEIWFKRDGCWMIKDFLIPERSWA